MSVIESDDYRKEIETLAADPIIQQMAKEMYLMPADEYESWHFIWAASEEYHKRGGTSDHSIGGPARAIKKIMLGV